MYLCSLKFPSVVKSKAMFQQGRPEVNETQVERGVKIRRLISLYHLFHVFVFMFIDFVCICICVWDCVFVYLFFKANIASQDNQVTSKHASLATPCTADPCPVPFDYFIIIMNHHQIYTMTSSLLPSQPL